jgi:hypothetical protein
MPTPNSLADKLKDWSQLRDRIKPLLGEVPHLQSDHAAFELELAGLIALDQRQEAITAELRRTTRLRDEAVERARKLRNRLSAGLQSHFGPESEQLIEFAVSPRKKRSRRTKGEKPPAAGGAAA